MPISTSFGFPTGGTRFFNSLQPGTFPGPTVYSSPGTVTADPFGALTNAGCGFISNPSLRALCQAGAGVLGGVLGGGGGGNGGGSTLATPVTCPPGYKQTAQGCQLEGIAPYIPGDIGRPDFIWTPVNGRYGAGVSPIGVAQTRLACPSGYKLGKDNVCYECLAKKERKWNPGTKPFMTGGDLNAVARVRRLKKRGRKMVATLGLNPTRCSTRKGKRK